MLRTALLVFGVFTLLGLCWLIGPSLILETFARLGPLAITVILLPMIVVYGLEAYGWHLALGTHAAKVGFARLFAIRMAGEVLNVTTPTAYMGGEPLKAYLLHRYGIPVVDGLASVVTAKTTMTLAQIFFILLGLGLMVWLIGATDQTMVAALFGIASLIVGAILFLAAQRYGLGVGVLTLFRKIRLPIQYLERRESQLIELDQTIQQFYSERRSTFLLTLGTYFLAWVTESVEVYAILYFLNEPAGPMASIAIAALSVLIKGGTFFIPGSLGAQEGGYVLLLLGFGFDEVTGIIFALIRRMRELLWILVGILCLAVLKGLRQEGSPTQVIDRE